MYLDIDEAVSQGFITPVSQLRVTRDIEDEFNGGIVFGDKDDLGTLDLLQCNFSSETRKKKIQERAQFSKYLLLPTKHSFPTTVRIYGYVLKFICNARKNRKFVGDLLRSTRVWFSAFPVDLNEVQFQTFGVVSSDQPLPDTVKLKSIAQKRHSNRI